MIFDVNDLKFDIIDILKIERKDWSNSTKRRDFSVLSYRFSGQGFFVQNSDVINYEKRSLIYVPPQIEYEQSTKGEFLIAIHLNIYNYDKNKIEILHLKNNYDSLLNNIYTTWRSKNWGYEYLCTSLIYKLLYYLYREHSNKVYANHEIHKILRPALEYINENFTRTELKIKEIADVSNISEVYLRKLFIKYFSQSPLKYINRLRIDYAKSLLESGYYTVSGVAEASGFSDPKYFSTTFKKSENMTPSDFIKK